MNATTESVAVPETTIPATTAPATTNPATTAQPSTTAATSRRTWPALLQAQLWLLAALGASIIGERQLLAPLMITTPMLLLVYLHRQPAGRGFLVGWLAYSLAWTVFMADFAPFMDTTSWALTIFSGSLLALLPLLADRLLRARLPVMLAVLVFPCAQLLVDQLRHYADPTGTYGLLGYSLPAGSPLAQLAGVTGIDGLTFLLALLASVGAHLWTSPSALAERLKLACAAGVSLGLLWLAGLALQQTALTPDAPVVRVASLARGIEREQLQTLPPSALLDDWLTRTRQAADQGAKLVVWGEGALSIPAAFESTALAAVQTLARDRQIDIVATVFHLDRSFDDKRHNKLVWIDSQGRISAVYHKNHGQFAERTVDGDGKLALIDTAWGRFALSICWDADFPRFMAQAGAQGAVAILNPSYDWPQIAGGRANIARYRSIENGVAMIRPNNNGHSFISDSKGRLLASQQNRAYEAVSLIVDLPLAVQKRTAATLGFWPALLAGLVFAGLLIRARRRAGTAS